MHCFPLLPTSQYKEWNIIQHIANVSGFPISYPLFESQNKTKDEQSQSDYNIVLSYLKYGEFYILLSAFTDYY